MAHDLYGNQPTHEDGRHYRVALFAWSDWKGLCKVLPTVPAAVFNGEWDAAGGGLNEADAQALGTAFQQALQDGTAAAYFELRARDLVAEGNADWIAMFSIADVEIFARFLVSCGGYCVC